MSSRAWWKAVRLTLEAHKGHLGRTADALSTSEYMLKRDYPQIVELSAKIRYKRRQSMLDRRNAGASWKQIGKREGKTQTNVRGIVIGHAARTGQKVRGWPKEETRDQRYRDWRSWNGCCTRQTGT